MSTMKHDLDMKRHEVIQAAVEVKLAQEECVRARKEDDYGHSFDLARAHLLTTLLAYHRIAEEARGMEIRLANYHCSSPCLEPCGMIAGACK